MSMSIRDKQWYGVVAAGVAIVVAAAAACIVVADVVFTYMRMTQLLIVLNAMLPLECVQSSSADLFAKVCGPMRGTALSIQVPQR
jgi:hypothetical protein